MNSFFDQLGRNVQERWQHKNFSLEAFPEIARIAIEESPPAQAVDLDDFIAEFLLDDQQPFQSQSGFGQPELVAFVDQRFYIQILFWMDGTTDIHQHEFSGAFHVLAGSSIHAEFEFETHHKITPHLSTGDLKMKQIELLETGRTIEIHSGQSCIHSLFHLDTPSATVVIRTQNDPGTSPQFNYLPPHIAVDPIYADGLTMRRNQLLYMLDTIEHPNYVSLVHQTIANLDFERGFITLQHNMSRLQYLGEWEPVLAEFLNKHKKLATGVPATLAECLRRDHIVEMRRHIEDPDHRYFLALLMNAPSRADIFSLVTKRFPDQDPIVIILNWAEELIVPDDFGLALLDTAFPETMDVPIEAQAELLIGALRYGIEQESKDIEIPEELAELYEALKGSCLRVLFV